MIYLITAIVLFLYLVLAWLLGSWMHLIGPTLWIVRAGLALLGIAGAAAFLWFRRSRQPGSRAGAAGSPEGDQEMHLLLQAAEAKLSSARVPHRGGLGAMPIALVMGTPGSAKTSIVAHSGLDPELLAGAAFEDGSIVPTRSLNIWYADGAVFVEAAGHLLMDSKKWPAFVRRISPARLRSLLRGDPQPSRVALVCFDTEKLLGSPVDAAKQARFLRAKLGELAEHLGVQVPVYALFTRMDRLPFFTDYLRALSRDEAARVLGATLPLEGLSPGLYAEEQSARIGRSFDELFRSLAGARLEFLSRENDDLKTGCAYEFPREFRKLRGAVSDFLVELCRPSQFSVGPFLRGYYFTGVRPVIVENSGRAAATPVKEPVGAAVGATVLFRPAAAAIARESTPVQPSPGVRRVPQWVFLAQFFRDVILADRAAMGASGVSTKTQSMRRALLAASALLGFLLATAFTISWLGNRSLEARALAAARGLRSEPIRADAPTLDALERLDSLRDSVEILRHYRNGGAPLSHRWGLYRGNALYPQLRRIYFDRFGTLLFAETQTKLVEALHSLPSKPGADYGVVYDTLKAYLITTSNHNRSTSQFLDPILLDRWSQGRGIDATRLTLAARQFAFYVEELREENPYSFANDMFAVANARDYLAQFAGTERVYRAILAEAGRMYPPMSFNSRFPGSAAAVVDAYEVSGAFTEPAWQFVKGAIRNPARYFAGEQWVLGNQQNARIEKSQLEEQLHARYSTDFLNAWRAYLKSASVVRYANLQDAAHKLGLLAGNQSPLLAVLALAAENTTVDDPAVSGAFQAVQAVVPPGKTERLIAPPNQPYMTTLLALQSSAEQAAVQPGEATDAVAAPVLTAASEAKTAARQIAQGFKPDPEGHVDAIVKKLLEDPLTQVEGLLRVLGPQELNSKGKALCAALRPLFSKYPFDRNATAEASVAELNAAFRKPDGAFWTFYDANLQKLVTREGSQFVPAATAPVHVTPEFLGFLNQASTFSDALYGGGSQEPHFAYTLTPAQAEGIQNFGLSLDGQTLSYNGGAAAPQQFTWQGIASHEAKASVRFGSGPDLVWSNSQGPWAIFHFFDKADRWQPGASGFSLGWVIRIGKDPVTLPGGKPLTVHLDLSMSNLPPILQSGYFARLACVAAVAR